MDVKVARGRNMLWPIWRHSR